MMRQVGTAAQLIKGICWHNARVNKGSVKQYLGEADYQATPAADFAA
jgi:hypothetical protein